MATTQKITLKGKTTFTCKHSNATLVVTREAGTEVDYSRTEDATHVIHTASVECNGRVYTSVKRVAKDVQPTNGTIKAVANTSSGAMAAAARTAGKEVKGVDDMERRVTQQQRVVKELTGNLYQVNYYIPEQLDHLVPNPSPIFRRHGVRLDGSNWIMTEAGVNHPDVQAVFAHMRAVAAEHTVRVRSRFGYVETTTVEHWTVPYHPAVVEQFRKMAEDKLAKEIIAIHTSLIERLEKAAKRLDEANAKLPPDATQNDRDALQEAYLASVRGTVNNATKCFADAIKAAESFDETENLSDLFEGVRQAIRAEGLAQNAKLAAAGRKTAKLPEEVA